MGQLDYFLVRYDTLSPVDPLSTLTPELPSIIEFDPDGELIQSLQSIPLRLTSMPSDAVSIDKLCHRPGNTVNHKMCRGLGLRIAEPGYRATSAHSGGIVHNQEPWLQGAAAIRALPKLHIETRLTLDEPVFFYLHEFPSQRRKNAQLSMLSSIKFIRKVILQNTT
jgi:hypothetical protein